MFPPMWPFCHYQFATAMGPQVWDSPYPMSWQVRVGAQHRCAHVRKISAWLSPCGLGARLFRRKKSEKASATPSYVILSPATLLALAGFLEYLHQPLRDHLVFPILELPHRKPKAVRIPLRPMLLMMLTARRRIWVPPAHPA